MSKIIKFIKENKILVFALGVIVLSFVFLALPGQFVKYGLSRDKDYIFELSGYEFMFGIDLAGLPKKASAQGIAIFVMLILSIVGIAFSKKSSFVEMVTGLVLITVSILFFTISEAGAKVYTEFLKGDYAYCWVPYLLGGLLVVAGLLVVYKAVMTMKDEIKHPAAPKGPSYNYLHK